MGLGTRNARHQTVASAHTAVDSSQWWDFKPGQRVMTCDKIAGVVTEVEDGPFAGSEAYRVVLDQGMGGGLYTSGQLTTIGDTTTASREGTAAADYPELGDILVQRPDIARNTTMASRRAPAPEPAPEPVVVEPFVATASAEPEEDHLGILVQASVDPDLRFHVTASWADVREKAKRIRTTGGVNLISAHEGALVAYVQGDHGVYEAELSLVPGSRKVATWQCGCKWAAYSWGRSPRFRRFEGRMCSHALATQYEAQSRGMFGRSVDEDEKLAPFVKRRVIVDYDPDSGRNRQRNVTPQRNHRHVFTSLEPTQAALESPLTAILIEADLTQVDPAEMALLLATAGLDPRRPMAMARQAAVDESAERMREHHRQHNHVDHDRAYVYPYWGGALCTTCVGSGCGTCHGTGLAASGVQTMAPSGPMGGDAGGAGAAAGGDAGGGSGGGSTTGSLDTCANCAQEVGYANGVWVHTASRSLECEAAANDPFGDNGDPDQGYTSRTPTTDDGNPASTGFATSADPDTWSDGVSPYGRMGSLAEGDDDLGLDFAATLNPEPEPALPSTDGMEDEALSPDKEASLRPQHLAERGSVDDIVQRFQASAGSAALMSGERTSANTRAGDSEIAAVAKRFLATGQVPTPEATVDPETLIGDDPSLGKPIVSTALKNYSPGEQRQIIEEGKGVTASNFDRLDIKGTHYEAMAAAADDDDWMA